jgi:hypothetical protein
MPTSGESEDAANAASPLLDLTSAKKVKLIIYQNPT